jgi:ParB-like chromosome segregation protein Spo0J
MSPDAAKGTLKPHPAADTFPVLDGIEFEQLIDDIRAHGLLEPIVVHERMILDGRNRQRACELAGVEPCYEEWVSNGRTPIEFVVSKNLHRRHLTAAQRAAIAAELLPEFEKEAKARRINNVRTGGDRPTGHSRPVEGRSADKAAALVKVGKSSVKAAKAIREKDPAVFEEMRRGKVTVAEGTRRVSSRPRPSRLTSSDRPKVMYGRGDKFVESTEPLARYLKKWKGNDYRFEHVNPREATRRLKKVCALIDGLECTRADLENRSMTTTKSVDRHRHPSGTVVLSPQQEALTRVSAISCEVPQKRGYRTVAGVSGRSRRSVRFMRVGRGASPPYFFYVGREGLA